MVENWWWRRRCNWWDDHEDLMMKRWDWDEPTDCHRQRFIDRYRDRDRQTEKQRCMNTNHFKKVKSSHSHTFLAQSQLYDLNLNLTFNLNLNLILQSFKTWESLRKFKKDKRINIIVSNFTFLSRIEYLDMNWSDVLVNQVMTSERDLGRRI